MVYETANGYYINFNVEAASYYISKISNSILHAYITDSFGMEVMDVVIPDYIAYQMYEALDVMSLAEDNDLGSISAKTLEVPPNQGTRYSLILLRDEPVPILMKVLETNMISKQHSTVDLVLDINDPQFGQFLGFLYLNFYMCATEAGYKPDYYYSHLEEFFNPPFTY